MTHHLRFLARGLLPLALLALGACHDTPSRSNGGTPGATVQELNSEILALLAELDGASPTEVDALQAKAATLLVERRLALTALADTHPAEAVAVAFPVDVLATLAAAFPGSAAELESWGERQGLVESHFIDAENDLGSFLARLLTPDGELALRFAIPPPVLLSGTILRAGGVIVTGRLVVVGAERLAGDGVPKGPGDPPCLPTGEQRVVALLVHGTEEAQPDMTPESWADVFFSTTDTSLDDYWREVSYGRTSASGDVFGYFVVDQAVLSTDLGTLTRAAIAAADSVVDFRAYDRIFVLHPWPGTTWGTPRAGGAAGVGSFGCWGQSSTGDGAFTASTSAIGLTGTIDRVLALHMLVHEGGHNLGLAHSASRTFGAEALGAPAIYGEYLEYGDIASAMGSLSVHGLNHYPAAHKARLGWLPAGAVQDVTTAGTYDVAPLEQAAVLPLSLRVRRGDTPEAWLWIESRRSLGYDQGTSAQITGGVLLHLEDGATGYAYTNLLDFTPNATTPWPWDPALSGGMSWSDPYSGLSLTVTGVSPSGATLNVTYGATPCVEADPLLALSPPATGVEPGGQAALSLAATNRDTSGCAARTFTLASALPAAWPSAFSNASLSLDPGQSATVTLTKSVPADAPLGTYAVDASASAGASVGVASSYVTVAPPPALVVNLFVGATLYAVGSTVPLRATVTFGPSPVSGARVTINVTEPDGRLVSRSLRTRSSGQVSWDYRARKRGFHVARASATSDSDIAASAQVLFEVQ